MLQPSCASTGQHVLPAECRRKPGTPLEVIDILEVRRTDRYSPQLGGISCRGRPFGLGSSANGSYAHKFSVICEYHVSIAARREQPQHPTVPNHIHFDATEITGSMATPQISTTYGGYKMFVTSKYCRNLRKRANANCPVDREPAACPPVGSSWRGIQELIIRFAYAPQILPVVTRISASAR